MDTTHILEQLNPAQREAVSAPLGNLLVLAGAGSGKTRVLVHRVAWLIQHERVTPRSVLAVTFTNKAAKELRERLETLLKQSLDGMWVGTFHGLAHKLLRIHWQQAGLPQTFQILDSDDQLRLIKRAQQDLNVEESLWQPRKIQTFINTQKDEGRRPHHLDDDGDPHRRTLIDIYRAYQAICERNGQVDFAELLLRTHETLRDNQDLLQHYQDKFQHLLVDEFQDTNAIQYAWLRLLAGERENLFAVGDDDQAIYGWRGAKVENIQMLQQDRPNTRLLRMEQNYRSTKAILDAANKLIDKNTSRLGKTLWTDSDAGTPVHIHRVFNEIDEARFVVERIQDFVKTGRHHAEVAILYRTTAQSRLFEEALIRAQLPYRIYGGLRFFDRAEIKDAMAYLRLVANPSDDTSFERASGTPPRGIGTRSIEVLREYAQQHSGSLWQALLHLPKGALAAQTLPALGNFARLFDGLRRDIQGLTLTEIVEKVIKTSGLREHYEQLKDGSGPDRKENLAELINVSSRFSDAYTEGTTASLDDFLAYTALEAGESQGEGIGDPVQLMTLHAAKGLEFPLVFIVGLEEGLFPHQMSSRDPQRLEEERRLCYVGMTRAMQELYLTHAENRRLYGPSAPTLPSRFLGEIQPTAASKSKHESKHIAKSSPWHHPKPEIKHESKYDNTVVSSQQTKVTSAGRPRMPGGLRVGQRVFHAKFGEGTVRGLEGQGSEARVQVQFGDNLPKWLSIVHANLQLVG